MEKLLMFIFTFAVTMIGTMITAWVAVGLYLFLRMVFRIANDDI